MAKVTKLDQHPEYRQAFDRWQHLKGQLAKVEDKIRAELTETASVVSVDARAEALVRGEDLTKAKNFELKNTTYAELCDQRSVLLKAIDIASRKIDEIRGKLSREACEQQRPHYRGLVQNVRTAALALVEAARDIENFRSEITDAGLNFTLPEAAAFTALGKPEDQSSRIAIYMREMKDAGLL